MTEDQQSSLLRVGRSCALDPACRVLKLLGWEDEVADRHHIASLSSRGLVRTWSTCGMLYVGMTRRGQHEARRLLDNGYDRG